MANFQSPSPMLGPSSWPAAGPFSPYAAHHPQPPPIHGVRRVPTPNPNAFGIATGVPGPFIKEPPQPNRFQTILPRGDGIPINIRRYQARPRPAAAAAPAAKKAQVKAPPPQKGGRGGKAGSAAGSYYDGGSNYYEGGSYEGGYYDYDGYGYYDGNYSYYGGGNSEYYYN